MKFGIRLDVYVCLVVYELTKTRSEEIIELVQVRDEYGLREITTCDANYYKGVMQ